jgi:GLPGLI family protein
MNKKLLTVIFFLITILCFSQQGEITFESVYFNVPNVEKDKDFMMKISREINDMKYSLRFKENESFFEYLHHVPHDEFMAKLATVIVVANNNWYQDAKTKNAFYNRKIKDSTYIVVFENRMKGWTLHNETKEIDGYTCYKASKQYIQYYTEKEYTIEAWYTPEIPVPYGPIGFGGLPGLILQLQYSHVIYIAKGLTLNPKNGIKKYSLLKQGRYIGETEMHTLQRRARKVTED